MLLADRKGNVLEIDRAFTELTGYDRDDILSRAHKEITPRNIAPRVAGLTSEVIESGRPQTNT